MIAFLKPLIGYVLVLAPYVPTILRSLGKNHAADVIDTIFNLEILRDNFPAEVQANLASPVPGKILTMGVGAGLLHTSDKPYDEKDRGE